MGLPFTFGVPNVKINQEQTPRRLRRSVLPVLLLHCANVGGRSRSIRFEVRNHAATGKVALLHSGHTLYFDVRAKFAQIGHTSIFSIFYSQEDHGQTFLRVTCSDYCDDFRMYAIPDRYATDKLWCVSIIRKRHSWTQELLMRYLSSFTSPLPWRQGSRIRP